MGKVSRLLEARAILVDLGLPKAQQNERTALCLLALLNLTDDKPWNLDYAHNQRSGRLSLFNDAICV